MGRPASSRTPLPWPDEQVVSRHHLDITYPFGESMVTIVTRYNNAVCPKISPASQMFLARMKGRRPPAWPQPINLVLINRLQLGNYAQVATMSLESRRRCA